MSYCETKEKKHLEYNDLLEEFILGCKQDEKIGFEYERIPIVKKTKEIASYYGIDGVCEALREYARNENWDYILDNNEIIGLKKLHNIITLEPGSQIELSVEPQSNIHDLKKKIEEIDSTLIPTLNKFGIELINKGCSPTTTYKNIKLIPKQRYHIMANYLWGILSDVMMRETAGIQVGIDYKNEEDAMQKFRVANLMQPFTTAMFANSKIRGKVDTGYKSFRALAWLNTDNERCGFATDFSSRMAFKDYVETLLDTPMIFINRKNTTLSVNGRVTFRQFMDKGFEGFDANIEDWKLHSNLFFPEVRLRSFIEIRNQDCVGNGLEYSIPALYKGIMYDKNSLEEVEKMLLQYSFNELNELRYNVPKYAIHSKLRGKCITNICKEILEISYSTLKTQGNDEEKFLEPIIELINKNKTPADI